MIRLPHEKGVLSSVTDFVQLLIAATVEFVAAVELSFVLFSLATFVAFAAPFAYGF